MTTPPKTIMEIEEYILRVFPCQKPCDSFGVCDNCCNATLIRAGASIRDKLDNEEIEHLNKRIIAAWGAKDKETKALEIAVEAFEHIIACSNLPSYPEPVESKIAKKALAEIRKLRGDR